MLVCETCLHRGMCEDKYTMTPQYSCINYNSGRHIIIDELEKIKDKINRLHSKEKTDCDIIFIEKDTIFELIDEEIFKLKGEKND